MNNITNNTNENNAILETFASRLFWMIFFCFFSLISLSCFYFYFYHLFGRRQLLLYQKLNNHTLLCLLITDYLLVQTELPITIGFLTKNRVLIETQSFCVFWNYWYYVWSTMSIQFSMLTAINRYLFIFHKAFLMKYKVYCHYLPIACIWLYLPCLHLYFIVFFPYGNTTFNFSKAWCGGPQFVFMTVFVSWDTFFDTLIPIVVIVLFNIIITMRVILLKKVSTNARSKWKKNRRMILQMLGICCLQLIGGVPYSIITLGVIYGSPTFALYSYTQVFIYTFYIPSIFSPFFAVVTLPKEVRDKLTQVFRCRKMKQTHGNTEGISVTDVGVTTKGRLQLMNINRSTSTAIKQ